jgi:hypothetical protein
VCRVPRGWVAPELSSAEINAPGSGTRSGKARIASFLDVLDLTINVAFRPRLTDENETLPALPQGAVKIHQIAAELFPLSANI